MRGSIRFGAPSTAELDEFIDARRGAAPTYDHVGSTLAAGAGRYARSVDLGSAPGAFERGAAGLRAWACHAGIGASVHPPDAALEVGTDVLVVLPVGPLRVLVPTRVVAVVDEPDRFGFAYGTLPGHPEAGEEGFFVERDAGGTVRATIRVESRGAWLLSRLGRPVAVRFQRFALARYLRALQRFVEPAAGLSRQ